MRGSQRGKETHTHTDRQREKEEEKEEKSRQDVRRQLASASERKEINPM